MRANELRSAAERARDDAIEARDELKQRHAAVLARTEDDHVKALAAAGALRAALRMMPFDALWLHASWRAAGARYRLARGGGRRAGNGG